MQLAVYATLRWYVEQEAPGVESRMRSLPARDLLFQLPYLQRLQRRLLDCVPRGAAMHDPVVLVSCTVQQESTPGARIAHTSSGLVSPAHVPAPPSRPHSNLSHQHTHHHHHHSTICRPLPRLQCALSLVVKESFKLYKAVSEGIINLADTFFEMELHDASEHSSGMM